jgi:hypothetical protein
MTFGRMQVQSGMEVVGTGGQLIGRVAENYDDVFHVVRPDQEDVYVPYDVIRAMLGEQIVLDVRPDEIDARGWSSPPIEGRLE